MSFFFITNSDWCMLCRHHQYLCLLVLVINFPPGCTSISRRCFLGMIPICCSWMVVIIFLASTHLLAGKGCILLSKLFAIHWVIKAGWMYQTDILNVQNFTQPYLGKNNLRQKERRYFQNLKVVVIYKKTLKYRIFKKYSKNTL